MVEAGIVEQGHQRIDRALGGRDQAGVAQLEEQSGQADGDADARQLRLGVMAGEVVVTATRADRADLRVGIQRGLVDHAGVIVEAARDRQVDRVARLCHAHGPEPLQHLAQLVAAFLEQRRPGAQRVEFRQRVVMAVGAHARERQQLVGNGHAKAETLADQGRAHRVLAALVELVDLA